MRSKRDFWSDNDRDSGTDGMMVREFMSIERVNNFGDELRLNIKNCSLQLTVPCYC